MFMVVGYFAIVFRFRFDEEKAIATLLYISRTLIERRLKPDLHKIFKIMYFADIKHMVKYGRSVTSDYYVAMADGPVPSQIYDMAKAVRGDSMACSSDKYTPFFEIRGRYIVSPKRPPNLENLSGSDIECLYQSFLENQGLTYNQLKKKSHDTAYDRADKNKNSEISPEDMALVGGGNGVAITYMQEVAEAQGFVKIWSTRSTRSNSGQRRG
jgi:hypothetical protein